MVPRARDHLPTAIELDRVPVRIADRGVGAVSGARGRILHAAAVLDGQGHDPLDVGDFEAELVHGEFFEINGSANRHELQCQARKLTELGANGPVCTSRNFAPNACE